MDARTVELLNLELDGRMDAAGRAELDARLAADPAAREHREQLREVARVLAAAPPADVPPDFHAAVLRAAQLPRVQARRARRHWRTGLALAASLLAAALVLRIAGEGPRPDEGVSATLAPALPGATAISTAEALEIAFELPASGDIVLDFGPGGPLAARAGSVVARIEGRRIVLPAVAAGRTTVRVTGAAGPFTAAWVHDGTVTAVTVSHR